METLKAARIVGGLLAVIGALGVIIISFDSVLREYAILHFDALIVFVLVDFSIVSLLMIKPSKATFALVAIWSVLRIGLLIGDVLQGVSFNYLFNPFNVVDGNPPGIPGAVLDLMLILQVVVIPISLTAHNIHRS